MSSSLILEIVSLKSSPIVSRYQTRDWYRGRFSWSTASRASSRSIMPSRIWLLRNVSNSENPRAVM